MLKVDTFWLGTVLIRLSVPHLCVAMVGTTSIPSTADNLATSISHPLLRASSIMLSASENGSLISAICRDIRRALLKFFVSATCIMRSAFSLNNISLVTLSSSDIGTRLFTPGVSITVCLSPPMTAFPLLTSTVVPG